jgi:hypothetical protein
MRPESEWPRREEQLTAPSRIFGALLTAVSGLFLTAMASLTPFVGGWLSLALAILTIWMTVRVGRMAVVLGPDTLQVRAAFGPRRAYRRSDISSIAIVSTGNWGNTGVCLGLTLNGGNRVRLKAVNGYQGSEAMERADTAARRWLTTGA